MNAIRILLITRASEQCVDFEKGYRITLRRAGETQHKIATTQRFLALPERFARQPADSIPLDRLLDQPLRNDQREPRIPEWIGVDVKHEALRSPAAA